jgi:hypothetical protein
MTRFVAWSTLFVLLVVILYTAIDRSTRVYLVREGFAEPQLARTSTRAVLLLPKMRMGAQSNALLKRLHLGIWSLILSQPDTEYSAATLVEIGPRRIVTSTLPRGTWRAVTHEDHLVFDSFNFTGDKDFSYSRTCLEYAAGGTAPCTERLKQATSSEQTRRERSELNLDIDAAKPTWDVEYLSAKTISNDARFNFTVSGTPIVIHRQLRSTLHNESGEFDEDQLPFFRDEKIDISGIPGAAPAVFETSPWRKVDAQQYAAMFPKTAE